MNQKSKFYLSLFLIPFLFWGCKKESSVIDPIQENNSARDAIILLQYSYWASASKSHNYSNMKDLVVSGSNFDGATNVCKSTWDSGAELYYEFSNLKVVEYYETSAAIDGNVKMVQGADPSYNFSGTFKSYAQKNNGQWLLAGFNVT